MDTIGFCRKFYSSASNYLTYLREEELGRVIIRVRDIKCIANRKYQLFLAKRTPYVESLILCINSFAFHESIELGEDDVLEYNEQQIYIVIKTNERVGEIISKAKPSEVTIESDLTFLVDSVKKWYVANHNKVGFPTNPQLIESIKYPTDASLEQNNAIKNVLSSSVSYVWGAPGTGKTQMILANCISQYIDLGKRVLLVAPTNNALEQSLRGIIKVLDRENINRKRIIRLGKATSEFLYEYPEVCQTGYYDRLIESHKKDIENLLKRKQRQEEMDFLQREFHRFQLLCEALLEKATQAETIRFLIDQNNKSLLGFQASLKELEENFDSQKKRLCLLKQQQEQQQRYYLVIDNYQQFCNTIRAYDDNIGLLNTTLADLVERVTSITTTLNQEKIQLFAKKAILQNKQEYAKKITTKIKFFFKRKDRVSCFSEIDELLRTITSLEQVIDRLVQTENELSVSIHDAKERIATEKYAKENNPVLHEMSEQMYGTKLNYSDFQKKITEEVIGFSEFVPDEKLDEKCVVLLTEKGECEQSKIATQQMIYELTEVVSKCMNEQRQIEQEIKVIDKDIQKIIVDVFGEEYELEDAKNKFLVELNDYEDIKIKENLNDIIAQKQNQYQNLVLKLKDLMEDRLLIACTIDYATIHYAELRNELATDICHLFVDEAAYCPLIKAGVLFSFGVPVSLCGDHMQLPPICEIDRNSILNKEKFHNIFVWDMSALYFTEIFRDDFSFEDLKKMYVDDSPPTFENVQVSFLKKTYRFSTQLATILDKHIYKSGFYGTEDFVTEIQILNAPRDNNEKELRESHSEMRAIREYISNIKPQNFVILAPYRKQCTLLEKELKLPQGSVQTIHSAQGREWETVIISVTDASNKFFMSSRLKRSSGLKIVNTAVSRAKNKLILVMDYAKWQNSENELVSDIANSISQN